MTRLALSQVYAFVYSGIGIPIKFLCRECDISTFYVGDTEAPAEIIIKKEIILLRTFRPQTLLKCVQTLWPRSGVSQAETQLSPAPVCFNTSSLSSRTYDVP